MEDKEKKIKKKADSYLRYSGIAFQMAGLVFLSFFIGKKIDDYMGNAKPYIAMVTVLLVFTGYMYKLYVELFKEK